MAARQLELQRAYNSRSSAVSAWGAVRWITAIAAVAVLLSICGAAVLFHPINGAWRPPIPGRRPHAEPAEQAPSTAPEQTGSEPVVPQAAASDPNDDAVPPEAVADAQHVELEDVPSTYEDISNASPQAPVREQDVEISCDRLEPPVLPAWLADPYTVSDIVNGPPAVASDTEPAEQASTPDQLLPVASSYDWDVEATGEEATWTAASEPAEDFADQATDIPSDVAQNPAPVNKYSEAITAMRLPSQAQMAPVLAFMQRFVAPAAVWQACALLSTHPSFCNPQSNSAWRCSQLSSSASSSPHAGLWRPQLRWRTRPTAATSASIRVHQL